MDWLELLTLLALVVGLAMLAETFRAEPMWLHIRKARPGPSPRQRRWTGAGLALLMTGQLLNLQLEGDTVLWAVSFALIAAGAVCLLAALLRGPTETERHRRAQALRADDAGMS